MRNTTRISVPLLYLGKYMVKCLTATGISFDTGGLQIVQTWGPDCASLSEQIYF